MCRNVWIAGLLAVGCGGSGVTRSGVTRSDSAGVEIVQNDAPAWAEGAGWRLSAEPRLEIGRAEGDLPYIFSRVAGAVRLEDGRIVVADGQSSEVRFFDAQGRFLLKVGRKGKGPGEYTYLGPVDRCAGDSITVFDIGWQLKVYDEAGILGREERLLQPGTNSTPYKLACSRTGEFLITGWGELMSGGRPIIGLFRTAAPVYVLGRTGELELALGEYPSSERLGSEHGSRPHPFGKTTVLTLGDSAIYIGTADRFEIRVLDMTGKLTRLIRAPEGDRAITSKDVDRYRETRLASVRVEARPEAGREMRNMALPEALPAYADLRLDRAGFLWVQDWVRPGATDITWVVFDPSGQMLGRVRQPLAFRITEIGRDYVLGVTRDELGVERVTLYDLHKS